MLLLQFSTSHYCRKVRLALGYKQINYQVENLTPGVHIFKLKPLTGLTTTPVLLPQQEGQPKAIADSTNILRYLEQNFPEPSLTLANLDLQNQAWLLEDWLDESIGVASRFVYYDFRAKEGKNLDPSLFSQGVIRVVRYQYNINTAQVELAKKRIAQGMEILKPWQKGYLVGDRLSVADITAAALLSPLGVIEEYHRQYPWVFAKIKEIHHLAGEALPPGV